MAGEALNTEGLEVKVKYNNGKEEVTEDYTCSPEQLTVETDTINVSYNGGELKGIYNVNVKERNFVIANYPNKRNYKQGDSLDTTGLKVVLTETDNTETEITEQCICTPMKLDSSGNQIITITFGGDTEVGTFNVNVEKAVESIEINEELSNVKTQYIKGQRLNTEGLVLKVKYTDGSIDENVTDGMKFSKGFLNNEGIEEIRVTYEGKTTSYNVEVSKKEITDLKFNGTTKSTYYKGDTLDISSIELTATYNDGELLEINNTNYEQYEITYEPTVLSVVGSQKVIVTYEGKTAEFEVTVEDVTLEELKLSKLPTRLKYYIGDKLYADGLELEAIYSNGENVKITRGYICSPAEFTTSGTQKVTVTYGDKETSFDVEVLDETLQKLEIQQLPYKLEYYVGSILDLTGLILKATYSDGDVRIVELDEIDFPRTVLAEAGTRKITVNYEGKNVEFDVTVDEVDIAEILAVNNLKEKYYKGDILNTDGLVLIVRDAYGIEREIDVNTDENVEISPEKLDVVGEQDITVKYKNALPYTFKINVQEKTLREEITIQKVEIAKMPNKIEYKVGEKIDLTGLVIKVTYSDGSEKNVKFEDLNAVEYVFQTVGTKKVKLNYEGQGIEFNVNVKEAYTDNKDDNKDDSKDNNKDDNKNGNKDDNKDDNKNDNKDNNQNDNKDNDGNRNNTDNVEKNDVNKDEKNTNSNNDVNGNNSNNNSKDNEEEKSNTQTITNNQDEDLASSRLPQTGVGQAIIIAVIVLTVISAIVSGVLYIGYKKSE